MITLVTADDEEIARKSLEFLIMTELYDAHLVASASNGAELINIVEQYHPDIAVVDINMPVINGIDAIQFLQNRACRTKFILYTAYDDFSYVQQAIDLKVSGYLLKSDKREKSIGTIKRIMEDVTRLRNEKESLKHLMDVDSQMLPIMENEILYSIFLDIPANESFTTYCKLRKLTFSGLYMINMIPTRKTEEIYSSLFTREIFTKDEVAGIIGKASQYMLSLSLTGGSLMIFVPEAVSEDPDAWISSLLRSFRKICNETYCIDFLIGISRCCRDFENIGRAYKECTGVLQKATDGGIFLQSHEEGPRQDSLENTMAQELLHGLKRGIEAEIIAVTDKYEKIDKELSNVRIYDAVCRMAKDCSEISSALCIAIMKHRTRVKRSEGFRGLIRILLDVLEQYNGSGTESRNPYAAKAYDYIRSHAYEEISLNIVADEIGISPFYLSRLIKQEYHVTFINLLMEFRMARATEMVKNTRSQVNEIAKATGYANTAYFCKVFKRYTGKSISEYRQEMLMNELEEK